MTVDSTDNRPLPPNDLGAEMAVISAALLSRNRFDEVAGWLRPEDFYSAANREIFRALVELADRGDEVDIVSVAAELRDRGRLQFVGGPARLTEITDFTPDVAHVADHAMIVVRKARLRAFIATCQRLAAEGYSIGDAEEFMAAGVAELATAADDGSPDSTMYTGQELVAELFQRWQSPDPLPPLRTGIPDLDRYLRGLRRKQLIVIAAHAGIGKSALAANIVTHVLLQERREDKPCGVVIFTLEMGADEYMERLACALARLDSHKLEEGARAQMKDEEGRRLIGAMNSLGVSNLRIDDRGDNTAAQIRAKARRAAAHLKRDGSPLRLIVIDYAQIVSASTENKRRSENREQEVAVIGREAKRMAKELDCPVLLLAQLNEDSAKEKRKPRAKDLRESKALLHDADKVILVHNPSAIERTEAYANGDKPPVDENTVDEVDIIVGKHRGGAPFTVRVGYWPALTLFGSLPT